MKSKDVSRSTANPLRNLSGRGFTDVPKDVRVLSDKTGPSLEMVHAI